MCPNPYESPQLSGKTARPSLQRRILRLPGEVMIGMVRLYQIFLSPWLGRNCRFEPSCSQYFILAVRKYGAVRGAFLGAWRIVRCNPFCRGGYDPP
jgi:putative membrane protein insertion efficiency factor